MRQGAHTHWECRYHLVWCPKYRKNLFKDEWLKNYTWELFKKIVQEYGMYIEKMQIAEDHVHLLVEIPPKMSVSEAVRTIKSISAREVFEKFPSIKKRLWAGELWADGYFVRSVGSEVTNEMVKKYIEEHEERVSNPAQLRLGLKVQPKRA